MSGPGSWRVDGYLLDTLLGIGRCGESWRGIRVASRDVVTVKKLAADAADVDELRGRAAVIGSFGSPHIVAIRDVVTTSDGAVALISDFAAGGSLASLLDDRGDLAAPEVVTLVAALASGLAAAHARGVAHGHVVATNVVFTPDGCPMLTDFAMTNAARPADDVTALARLGRDVLRVNASNAGLVELLELAIAGDIEAARLASSVLATGPAAPIRKLAEHPHNIATALRGEVRADGASRRGLLRFAALAGVVAIGLVGAVTAGSAWARHDAPAAGAAEAPGPAVSAPVVTPSAARQDWLHVVADLEAARDEALGQRQLALLSRADAAGSAALSRDRASIASMIRSGIRSVGLASTVIATHLVNSSVGQVTLLVLDKVTSYDLVDETGHVLAQRRARPPHAFQMQLRRDPGGWRFVDVWDAVRR
jgi:hypothetical protein